MKKNFYKIALGTATVSLLIAATLQSASMAGAGTPGGSRGPLNEPTFQGAGPWQVNSNAATVARVCPAVANAASCNALVLGEDQVAGHSPFGNSGRGLVSTNDTFADNVNALSPAQIISAYNFPTTSPSGGLPGTGKTIAIVDAYNDPNIASDLATFDTQFSIPQLNSCTITATSGPCFQKINWSGGTTYPAFDQGWALEISLDVEWVHAIAPGASILLVEATSNSVPDLVRAITYASMKAQYVSMSFGAAELSAETSTYDRAFTSTTASYFAAAGDAGLSTEWPSTSPKVISVGGTTLSLTSTGTVASETGWINGGGGCSTYETATTSEANYPTYAQANCAGKRATPDVAADADPNTGVFVYNSNNFYGTTGWYTVGGTSLSTPIWAARSADSGVVVNSAYIYGTNAINFYDVTQGGNAAGCLVGYDMCSGLGSRNN
ncbi:MAG TPA: S53 family peptidase [Acidimicrobiales bacterium]